MLSMGMSTVALTLWRAVQVAVRQMPDQSGFHRKWKERNCRQPTEPTLLRKMGVKRLSFFRLL